MSKCPKLFNVYFSFYSILNAKYNSVLLNVLTVTRKGKIGEVKSKGKCKSEKKAKANASFFYPHISSLKLKFWVATTLQRNSHVRTPIEATLPDYTLEPCG
jgi:hypothetical protein